MFNIAHAEVLSAVQRALAEDIGTGDVTTELTVPFETVATAQIFARQALTLAGVELLPLVFDTILPGAVVCQLLHASGSRLEKGDPIAVLKGPARTLLAGERTALNLLQRLSGVATLASAFADAVKGTGCRVLDTRKTTPGLRRLEKMACAAGGATNHRAGLYDAVLIKNNHITAAGGVRAALERAARASVPVEIEVRTRAELDEALTAGATHLLLDNLTPSEAKEWIAHIAGRATVELSGGITLETVRAFAETGADYVSCGAMTHSAPAVDINMHLDLGPLVQ